MSIAKKTTRWGLYLILGLCISFTSHQVFADDEPPNFSIVYDCLVENGVENTIYWRFINHEDDTIRLQTSRYTPGQGREHPPRTFSTGETRFTLTTTYDGTIVWTARARNQHGTRTKTASADTTTPKTCWFLETPTPTNTPTHTPTNTPTHTHTNTPTPTPTTPVTATPTFTPNPQFDGEIRRFSPEASFTEVSVDRFTTALRNTGQDFIPLSHLRYSIVTPDGTLIAQSRFFPVPPLPRRWFFFSPHRWNYTLPTPLESYDIIVEWVIVRHGEVRHLIDTETVHFSGIPTSNLLSTALLISTTLGIGLRRLLA